MVKWFIITPVVFIIFLVSASASYQDDVIDCYSYDTNGNGDNGVLEGTLTDGASIDNSVKKIGAGSVLLDGDNDYVDITNKEFNFNDTTDWTVCLWHNHDADENAMFIDTRTGASGAGWRWYIGDDGSAPTDRRLRLQIKSNTTNTSTYGSATYNDYNDWFFVCVVVDRDGNISHYNSGVYNGSIESGNVGNVNSDVAHLGIRSFSTDAVQYDGNIDEVVFYNAIKSAGDILDLYNSGSGRACSDILAGTPAPTLSINLNLINNTQNYNNQYVEIYYNGTFTNENTDLANCTVYVNELPVNNNSNANLSVNQLYNHTYGAVSGWFNFSINCTNYENSDFTGYYYYNIDTLQPVIRSSFKNNTVFNDTNVFSFYVNFTDDNLDGYEINFTNIDGNTWLTTVSAYNLTTSFAENTTNEILNSLDIGNYTVTAVGWDSHNPIEGIHEKYSKLEDKKLYFGENWLNLEDPNIKEYKIFSEDNKYKEEIKFYNESGVMTISSNHEIRIIKSKHTAHLLIKNLGKYRDLDSEDFLVSHLVQANPYTVQVTYTVLNSKVKFNSIGDININTVSWSFSVQEEVSLSDQYLLSILEQEELQTDDIEEIKEGVNLIPEIMFWLGFNSLVYWLVIKGEFLIGMVGLLSTLGIDLVITGRLYDRWANLWVGNSLGNRFVGLGAVLLLMTLIAFKVGSMIILPIKRVKRVRG